MDYPKYSKNRDPEYLFQQAKGGNEIALSKLDNFVCETIIRAKKLNELSDQEKDHFAFATWDPDKGLITTMNKSIRECRLEWRSENEFWGYVWYVWDRRYKGKIEEERERRIKEISLEGWSKIPEKVRKELGLEEVPKEEKVFEKMVGQQPPIEEISEEEKLIIETVNVMDTPALYDIELDLFGVKGKDGIIRVDFDGPKMKNFLQRIADRVARRLREKGISPATLSRLRGKAMK